MSFTNFPNGVTSFGVPVMGGVPVPFTGKYFFVDAVNGYDGFPGTKEKPFATLYKAHSMCLAGRNDVVFLVSDGTSASTARLSLANAVSVDPTATTGVLSWSKNATHLIGIAAGGINSRARIAAPTGTYTKVTFNSLNFVDVTGVGCYFANISAYQGFSTGATGQICWQDAGRNVYSNCQLLGMNDAASAQGTASRTLKLTGNVGESTFIRCMIGGDTTTRTVANASLELAGATPRNRFIECVFPFQTSNAGVLGILGTGNDCVDRWNLFERCVFINNISSTSTQMTALASFTTNAPGGMLVFKDCDTVGITKMGDTNALANSYVGNVGGAATGGLDVNPS